MTALDASESPEAPGAEEDQAIAEIWRRISGVRPMLRSHVQIHRHHYREAVWYVLQDKLTGRYHRFTPDAHRVIGLMDGRRTLQAVLLDANTRLEEPVSEKQICWIVQQLQAADLLQSELPANSDELLARLQRKQKMMRLAKFRSPLFIKFPLLDPERLINRLAPWVCPIFSAWGLTLWLLLLLGALVLAGIHWVDLTGNLIDRALSAQNILILLLVYPVVKSLHEFGHAFAVKRWGGEVHEMGLMLLVFMPIPYVDASAASAFRQRRHRMLVGAAGMFVEMFLAALAVIVWVNVEPGIVRAMAFNTILIAGVSTLLFNINPLLRFDGYYIFSDWLEMPNLAKRSNHYLLARLRRHLLRVPDKEQFPEPAGDKAIYVSYAITAFIYRMFILVGIVLVVAGKFFILGVILAVWAAFGMFGMPLLRFIQYLVTNPNLAGRRGGAGVMTTAILALLLIGLFVVPFPMWTRAEGVVWMPPESIVRTGVACFIDEVLVESGAQVEAGEVLVRCHEPLLNTNLRVNRARVQELELQIAAATARNSQVQLEILRERLRGAQADLDYTLALNAALDIRSPSAGIYIMPSPEDELARYYFQGQEIAYVIDPAKLLARVVIDQDDVTLIRDEPDKIEIKFTSNLDATLAARIGREVPEASDRLPSAALGSEGGGEIVLNTSSGGQATAFERYFQFDLEFLQPAQAAMIGQRLYARFDHGTMPLGLQWARSVRRLLIRRFEV